MLKLTLKEGTYTKYERARMIGSRALQISMGAPILVKIDQEILKKVKYNPIEIAKIEYEEGAMPMQVRRLKPHER